MKSWGKKYKSPVKWDGLKELGTGTGEMVQWLRALAVLPGDLGSIPSIHMVANSLDSSFRGSDTLFWNLCILHTCDTKTYMLAKLSYA